MRKGIRPAEAREMHTNIAVKILLWVGGWILFPILMIIWMAEERPCPTTEQTFDPRGRSAY